MDPNAVVEVFRHTIIEHYVDFQGRVRRQEFWYYIIAYVVMYVILGVVQSVMGTHALTGLYSLAMLLPTLGHFRAPSARHRPNRMVGGACRHSGDAAWTCSRRLR